jgi:hypothetical protein
MAGHKLDSRAQSPLEAAPAARHYLFLRNLPSLDRPVAFHDLL